jgi:hypothetical protein
VSVRPAGVAHTIYEELWHTTKWQSIVVQCDEAAAAAWMEKEPDFPSDAPVDEHTWEDIVREFLAGSARAVELARSGATLPERLENLAVHNAYHLGKIVALRQMIGAWPPPP